jgi:hypothetical protein
MRHFESFKGLNWLDNDIGRFFNDDNPTMFGCTDNCIKKFQRCYMYKDKEANFISKKIHDIMRNCENVNRSV